MLLDGVITEFRVVLECCDGEFEVVVQHNVRLEVLEIATLASPYKMLIH